MLNKKLKTEILKSQHNNIIEATRTYFYLTTKYVFAIGKYLYNDHYTLHAASAKQLFSLALHYMHAVRFNRFGLKCSFQTRWGLRIHYFCRKKKKKTEIYYGKHNRKYIFTIRFNHNGNILCRFTYKLVRKKIQTIELLQNITKMITSKI